MRQRGVPEYIENPGLLVCPPDDVSKMPLSGLVTCNNCNTYNKLKTYKCVKYIKNVFIVNEILNIEK